MGSKSASKKAAKADRSVAKLPKKKCCLDSPRCNRCPIRMLKEGTLPPGYTVKKRQLVKVKVKVKVKKDARKSGTRAA